MAANEIGLKSYFESSNMRKGRAILKNNTDLVTSIEVSIADSLSIYGLFKPKPDYPLTTDLRPVFYLFNVNVCPIYYPLATQASAKVELENCLSFSQLDPFLSKR
jgi:hypothetical protein